MIQTKEIYQNAALPWSYWCSINQYL